MGISIKTENGKFIAVSAKTQKQLKKLTSIAAKLTEVLAGMEELGTKPRRRRRRKNKVAKKAK